MELLELYEIREVQGIRVQCLPIDFGEWDQSWDICEYSQCALRGTCGNDVACNQLERMDKTEVFFKKVKHCENAACAHHACMTDDCMYKKENTHLGERKCHEYHPQL